MEDQKDISKQGYKDDSPYKDRPYLDIHTPNGVIDMTDVSIPLLANNVLLGPNSGLHKFDTNMVREIPLARYGGSVKQSPYDKEKFALKDRDGIIADMMRNGAFLPKFKMGSEISALFHEFNNVSIIFLDYGNMLQITFNNGKKGKEKKKGRIRLYRLFRATRKDILKKLMPAIQKARECFYG